MAIDRTIRLSGRIREREREMEWIGEKLDRIYRRQVLPRGGHVRVRDYGDQCGKLCLFQAESHPLRNQCSNVGPLLISVIGPSSNPLSNEKILKIHYFLRRILIYGKKICKLFFQILIIFLRNSVIIVDLLIHST